MIVTIDARSVRAIDPELWRLGALRLARTPAGLCADVGGDVLDAATRVLARSGIALTATAGVIDEGAPLVAAIARTLAPLGAVPVRCDIVSLRPVSVARATRALHRTPGFIRRPSAREVARCRAILHDEEHVLAWRRVVWADRSVFRRPLAGMRPVVFDRDAVRRSAERWTFATDGQVERWLAA